MRLSITAKVFLAFTVVVVCFAAASVYAVHRMRRLHDAARVIQDGHLRGLLALSAAGGNLKRFDAVLEQRDPVVLEKTLTVSQRLHPFPTVVRRHVGEVHKAVRRTLSPGLPAEERALVRDLEAELAQLRRGLSELEEGADELWLAVLQRDFSRATDVQERLAELSDSLQVRIGRLTWTLRGSLARSVGRAEEEERRAVWAVILFSGLAIVVAVAVTLAAGWALRPVRRLTEAVKLVSTGREVRRVEVETSDEVGVLAAEFNRMVESLEQRDRALRHSERLATVGRMAAQVAHEVRNPLMSIGLNTELLEEELLELGDPAAAEARTLLHCIQAEVERLTGVTEGYLTLARLPEPELEPTDVNEVVEDLLVFSAEELARKDVEVERELTGDLPEVRADANQLRQALLNLVRNAADAMAGGGRLTVRTALVDGQVEVAVADTGPGIAPEEAERVFEPLWSTKPDGTGLGLAITRQIVEVHGGSIRCESRPGAGTTFFTRLPAVTRS